MSGVDYGKGRDLSVIQESIKILNDMLIMRYAPVYHLEDAFL